MPHGMIQQAADVADIASIIIASIFFAGLTACVVMMVWLEAHVSRYSYKAKYTKTQEAIKPPWDTR